MDKYIFILILVLYNADLAFGTPTTKTFKELDAAIESTDSYNAAYNKQIEDIKANITLFSQPDQGKALSLIYQELFKKYQFFNADSAIVYANKNIALSESISDNHLRTQSIIDKADVLARAGMFYEAINEMSEIEANVPDDLKMDFYLTKYNICQFASEYTHLSEYAYHYFQEKMQYADSIISSGDSDAFGYRSIYATILIEKEHNPDGAKEYLNNILKDYSPGMREYSVLMSQLAYAYAELGDSENQAYCLAESAISDIKGCVKENMAVRMLSNLMLGQGDISRARNYLYKSFVDANFYNAMMRNTQSGEVLPLISDAYDKMNRDRQNMLILITVLLTAVIFGVVMSYMIIHNKNKKLAIQNEELNQMHKKLIEANQNIQSSYSALEVVNQELSESKVRLEDSYSIQQSYLIRFIWFCSSTINKMGLYRTRLYRMLKTNKHNELVDMLTSTREINDIAVDFYHVFDEAFLAMRPNFIEKLNSLLKEPIIQKGAPNPTLSTEQRIYALIYLGISDNQKIADFLHCTVSTVYTYRSKMRARSTDSDSFEKAILAI